MRELDNIRIVLMEPSHPGNIGATARAMKNMCLQRLYLVKPRFFPHAEATARASGADDLLAKSVVCESLVEALQGCTLTVATSARQRSLRWPQLSPRQCARDVISKAQRSEVAIVFGRERSGLSNEEIDVCNYVVYIHCNPSYSSLNLAAAVQIIAYELLAASSDDTLSFPGDEESPAETELVEQFYEHLEKTLIALDFLDPSNPKHLMRRLRRLFSRSHLTHKEVNILRGILTATERKLWS